MEETTTQQPGVAVSAKVYNKWDYIPDVLVNNMYTSLITAM